MFASTTYFSLTEITDPAKHRAHNEWHQLDHRPENLLLPGVAWGDRWVRPPDCAAATIAAAPGYENVHYAIMYWFREPLADSLDDFFVLSERSFQWGRSPQIAFTRRPMRGFFVPVAAHVAPRLSMTAEAAVRRPVKGVFITLARLDRHDASAMEMFRWYDEVRIPDLLQCRGAAAAWTLAAEDRFLPPGESQPGAWPFADRGVRQGAPAPHRLQLLLLDEDPLDFLADVDARTPAWRRGGRLRDTGGVEDILFASPFRRVVPWEWDWFEGRGERSPGG